MTKNEMVAKLQEKRAWLPGRRVKIDFGPDGFLMIDGVDQTVTEDDGPADTVIGISWDDLQALDDGSLDPMTAMLRGRLRVDGDLSNAMQLQGVIAKLRS